MSSDATRARCRQMPVVRCHQVPDAARCQSPDTSCLMSPPRPSGGLGEVSRVPVLMSSALISGDVLPPSVLGPPDCDDERRAPAVKSGVPLLPMSAAKRFCSALSFRRRVLQTSPPAAPRSSTWTAASTAFTACGPSVTDLDGCKQTLPAMASGGGGDGGSSGGLDQLLGAINTLLPALHPRRRSHRRLTTEAVTGPA